MKRLFGLATLLGVAAGAAVYLKKVGALNVTDEEAEDGSHTYGVELKMPKAPETEAEPETSGEEAAAEEEKKLGFSFTVGAQLNEKIGQAKETFGQMKNAAVEAAKEIKESVTSAINSKINELKEDGAEAEEDLDDIVDEIKEAAEAVQEKAADAVEEASEYFEDRTPLEIIDEYLDKAEDKAEEVTDSLEDLFKEVDNG